MAAVLLLGGCRFAGGGIANSRIAGHNAQFSFNLDCHDRGAASGVLTFIDNAAGVSVRATPTNCQPSGGSGAVFFGTYATIAPTATGTGTFSFSATPSTPQKISSGSYRITLSGTGIPGGTYSNSGQVTGNVVQIA